MVLESITPLKMQLHTLQIVYIRKGIDKGCFTGTVFIDMRKAFDSVDHLLLLEKLGKLRIVEHEQRWFSHYLSNRKQSVLYEGVLSEPEEIRSGVPQGSILGPILFLLYINDITASLGKSQVLLLLMMQLYIIRATTFRS